MVAMQIKAMAHFYRRQTHTRLRKSVVCTTGMRQRHNGRMRDIEIQRNRILRVRARARARSRSGAERRTRRAALYFY